MGHHNSTRKCRARAALNVSLPSHSPHPFHLSAQEMPTYSEHEANEHEANEHEANEHEANMKARLPCDA